MRFRCIINWQLNRTVHSLHKDLNDHLSMCFMISLVTIALVNDVFKDDYKTAEKVYSVSVMFTKEMKHLQWKNCVLNKSFFWHIEHREVTDKVYSYACMSDLWRQLIHDSDYLNSVSLYSLCISCSNALNSIKAHCDKELKIYTDRLQFLLCLSLFRIKLWVISHITFLRSITEQLKSDEMFNSLIMTQYSKRILCLWLKISCCWEIHMPQLSWLRNERLKS